MFKSRECCKNLQIKKMDIRVQREDDLKLSPLKALLLTSAISFNTMATNKVIYGEDDRVEVSESSKQSLTDSVAAMVSKYYFTSNDAEESEYKLGYYSTLKSHRGYPTCGNMRFREQPTIASCSGFLIGENLMMTAGHCVVPRGQTVANAITSGCAGNKWVFNYTSNSVDKDGKLSIEKNDVYGCKKVVAGSYTQGLDYAVIELDRKAADKKVVKLNLKKNAVDVGTKIYVAGYPTGLPLKIADNASIKFNSKDRTTVSTDLDTFAGNSGSPVFNTNDEVVGILVSGEIDYAYDYENQCYNVNICKGYGKECDRQTFPWGASGESVTKLLSAYLDYKLTATLGDLRVDTNKNNKAGN